VIVLRTVLSTGALSLTFVTVCTPETIGLTTRVVAVLMVVDVVLVEDELPEDPALLVSRIDVIDDDALIPVDDVDLVTICCSYVVRYFVDVLEIPLASTDLVVTVSTVIFLPCGSVDVLVDLVTTGSVAGAVGAITRVVVGATTRVAVLVGVIVLVEDEPPDDPALLVSRIDLIDDDTLIPVDDVDLVTICCSYVVRYFVDVLGIPLASTDLVVTVSTVIFLPSGSVDVLVDLVTTGSVAGAVGAITRVVVGAATRVAVLVEVIVLVEDELPDDPALLVSRIDVIDDDALIPLDVVDLVTICCSYVVRYFVDVLGIPLASTDLVVTVSTVIFLPCGSVDVLVDLVTTGSVTGAVGATTRVVVGAAMRVAVLIGVIVLEEAESPDDPALLESRIDVVVCTTEVVGATTRVVVGAAMRVAVLIVGATTRVAVLVAIVVFVVSTLTVAGLTLEVDTVYVDGVDPPAEPPDDPVLVVPLIDVIVCVVLTPVEVVGLATTCCSYVG
jgi:hypothetical protein